MAISTTSPSDPKTQHVADAVLQPFLQSDFSAADYFNTTLLTLSQSTTHRHSNRTASLSDLTSQLGTLLSQLNAQTSRLSSTLTQLTDEIVRSGGRLAYEVELLRGETLGLGDVLEGDLRASIEILASGAGNTQVKYAEDEARSGQDRVGDGNGGQTTGSSDSGAEPEYLRKLRTLTTVRARLDEVVQTFGAAMQWPVAPSELAATQASGSILSVSAPTPSNPDLEVKAKRYVEELRSEFVAMLAAGIEGLESASSRVSELRALADVWKGTAEEKARLHVVEEMQKLVHEKARSLESSRRNGHDGQPTPRIMDYRYGAGLDSATLMSSTAKVPGTIAKTATAGGYGFLQNLRDFKNEMYAD